MLSGEDNGTGFFVWLPKTLPLDRLSISAPCFKTEMANWRKPIAKLLRNIQVTNVPLLFRKPVLNITFGTAQEDYQ